MKQQKFHIIFSWVIALLILAPAGYRLAHALFPGLSHSVKVYPIPGLYTFNINNRKGIRGKVKGLYMDLSHNLNQYDAWYKTKFTFRDELLDLYKNIKIDVLQSQPFPDKLILGKNDWMFTGDHFDGSLTEQLGISRMNPDEIDDLAETILGLQEWCVSRGIYYVFLPTWGKAGIYHDNIPMKLPAKPTNLEQLINTLIRKDVRVVDSRHELEKQRNKPLYFKHDSHWNGHGAWIAYSQLMDTLRKFNPDLPEFTTEDVTADTIYPGDMDIAKLLGRMSPYPSIYVNPKIRLARQVANQLTLPENYTYVQPENYENRYRNDSAGQKVLVFRDSFFVHLKPLLIESFNESVLIWHRIPDTALIKKEKPDVVIQQISERLINDMYYEMKRLENQK